MYLVGRKSGRRYAVPVAYTRDNGTLLIGSPFRFAWVRNLRTGQRVDIRLNGHRRPADVQVLTERGRRRRALRRAGPRQPLVRPVQQDQPRSGRQPEPADLHLTWAAGTRVARLAPR